MPPCGVVGAVGTGIVMRGVPLAIRRPKEYLTSEWAAADPLTKAAQMATAAINAQSGTTALRTGTAMAAHAAAANNPVPDGPDKVFLGKYVNSILILSP